MDLRHVIKANPVLAIMRNVPLEQTVDYGQAICDGGIRFFEVALNSRHGLEQIALLRRHFGDSVYIGAGTAITVELARKAVDAGAMFLLAPSSPLGVLQWCAKEGVPFLPGVLTPTEVNLCLDHGFSVLKLFPAGDMPRSYVKSLKGPLSQTDYVAIGGVSPETVPDFLRAGYIGVGLGSNLFPKEYAEQEDWVRASDHIRGMLEPLRS